jgi:hypothetical protein
MSYEILHIIADVMVAVGVLLIAIAATLRYWNDRP